MTRHPATVETLFAAINEVWPVSRAEDWDQVGLIVGSLSQPVRRVLLVVDVTEQTVSEAVQGEYDAIVAHHPLLLRGVTTIAETTSKGSFLTRLIRANCALIAAHTNADKPRHGVADVLAKRLKLRNATPIEVDAHDKHSGIGRVGMLPSPVSARALAEQLAEILPATTSGVRVAGPLNASVQRIAICPGAGDSLLEHPDVRGADVFITADLRHHPASESRELSAALGRGPILMDVSHWASEWLWLDTAASILAEKVPDVTCDVSNTRTDVWNASFGQRHESGETA